MKRAQGQGVGSRMMRTILAALKAKGKRGRDFVTSTL